MRTAPVLAVSCFLFSKRERPRPRLGRLLLNICDTAMFWCVRCFRNIPSPARVSISLTVEKPQERMSGGDGSLSIDAFKASSQSEKQSKLASHDVPLKVSQRHVRLWWMVGSVVVSAVKCPVRTFCSIFWSVCLVPPASPSYRRSSLRLTTQLMFPQNVWSWPEQSLLTKMGNDKISGSFFYLQLVTGKTFLPALLSSSNVRSSSSLVGSKLGNYVAKIH